MSTPPDPAEPVTVAMPQTEVEAAILQSTLEAEGISSWILGGLTSGFRAEVPGKTKLVVRAVDAERARAILEDYESDPHSESDET